MAVLVDEPVLVLVEADGHVLLEIIVLIHREAVIIERRRLKIIIENNVGLEVKLTAREGS